MFDNLLESVILIKKQQKKVPKMETEQKKRSKIVHKKIRWYILIFDVISRRGHEE